MLTRFAVIKKQSVAERWKRYKRQDFEERWGPERRRDSNSILISDVYNYLWARSFDDREVTDFNVRASLFQVK